jgi:hypothetical protein
MTRAERRARMERAKRRARQRRPAADPRVIGILSRTRRPCSCPYCHGHMRAWEGPTVQERKAVQA